MKFKKHTAYFLRVWASRFAYLATRLDPQERPRQQTVSTTTSNAYFQTWSDRA